MGEPVGAVELVVPGVVELETLPPTERRRSAPQVDEHVVDRAARAAEKLGHARLEVHPTDDPATRARMVVLDEIVLDAELGQDAAAVGFQEEPAVVAVDRRFDQDRPRELSWQSLHERAI